MGHSQRVWRNKYSLVPDTVKGSRGTDTVRCRAQTESWEARHCRVKYTQWGWRRKHHRAHCLRIWRYGTGGCREGEGPGMQVQPEDEAGEEKNLSAAQSGVCGREKGYAAATTEFEKKVGRRQPDTHPVPPSPARPSAGQTLRKNTEGSSSQDHHGAPSSGFPFPPDPLTWQQRAPPVPAPPGGNCAAAPRGQREGAGGAGPDRTAPPRSASTALRSA